MVMLTDVLRFDVADEAGRHCPLIDLGIALLADDYPPVTHIYFREDDETRYIDWEDVTDLDRVEKTIRVNHLDRAGKGEAAGDVFLKRDILDSLILDLLGRRTTRVCDLLLDASDGQLRVKAADAGLAPMLRRILRGKFFNADHDAMFDWKYVEFLRGDPAAVNNGAGYRMLINRLPAGEIARLTDYIPYLHAAELLKLLPDEKAADVLEATSIERQVQLIDELDQEQAVGLLCKMSPDLSTDLVGRLDLTTMRLYLSLMPTDCRERIVGLLKFPEDSVGGVMRNDIFVFPADLDRRTAAEDVQNRLDEVRFSALIFVSDGEKDGCLRGAISLRHLLSAENGRKLEEIMDPYLQTLGPFDDASEAAYRIIGSQLPAMAVVNADGKVIGAMTAEAAIARLLPASLGLGKFRVFS